MNDEPMIPEDTPLHNSLRGIFQVEPDGFVYGAQSMIQDLVDKMAKVMIGSPADVVENVLMQVGRSIIVILKENGATSEQAGEWGAGFCSLVLSKMDEMDNGQMHEGGRA